ncbi:hypothetical protein ASG90_17980 [Nocardioides sp. Soil797]|nr:hypothetical protein ASG90_17980 [Nocardioides sp. Soil797]
MEDTTVDPAAAPAQQLASATLTQDVVRGTYNAKVRLRGTPSASTDSWVIVSFGKTDSDGYTCRTVGTEDSSTVYWRAYGSSVPNLIRRGAYMELKNFVSATAKKDQFDCAYAETWEVLPEDAPDGTQAILYSGRGDYSLARKYDKPRLKLTASKRANVTPGVWKTIKVKVRNANPRVTAPSVRVSVKGKKVTSRTVKLGKVRPGATKTAKVRVKVQRGFSSKAKIKVTTRSLARTRKLRLT